MRKSLPISAFLIVSLVFFFSEAFPQGEVRETTERSRAEAVVYLLSGSSQEQVTPRQPVQSEEPGAQETYVSQVIIEASWGEKNRWYDKQESEPGEFGMHITGEGPPVTPSGFTVAPNGDIYINDPLNKRIQRYGPNGELVSVTPVSGGLMCVDEGNNVYVSQRGSIEKYDQAGGLQGTCQIDVGKKRISPTETESRELQNIYCDNSGRVHAAVSYDHRRVDESASSFMDTTWGGICQVGDASGAFPPEEQKRTMREHAFLGCNSAALSVGYFRGEPGRVYLISFGGDTINTYSSLQGSFFGCDENLDIYTTQWDRETGRTIVRKYNQKSTLVSTFGYRCDKPYLVPAGRGQFLDSNGNVYVLCESYEDGIQVTKWYRAD